MHAELEFFFSRKYLPKGNDIISILWQISNTENVKKNHLRCEITNYMGKKTDWENGCKTPSKHKRKVSPSYKSE